LEYVDEAHARYGLPVFVMELRQTDFRADRRPATTQENAEFLRLVHEGALKRPHFARYAWHKTYGEDDDSLMRFDGESQLTPVLGRQLRGLVSYSKRGLGTALFPHVLAGVNSMQASWHYTWMASNHSSLVTTRTTSFFVPMIFHDRAWDSITSWPSVLARLRTQRVVLGFNEIDQRDQANMTPQLAADTWERIVDALPRSVYLVSPCVASRADVVGSPFDIFMGIMRARGLRVDALALHAYEGWKAGPNFEPVRMAAMVGRYIDRMWARYGLPIWLTEVGMVDFSARPPIQATVEQNRIFLEHLVPELDRRPYLERWAWFTLPTGVGGSQAAIGLVDRDTGEPTPLGRDFASLLPLPHRLRVAPPA
jgi:hypothetical protein